MFPINFLCAALEPLDARWCRKKLSISVLVNNLFPWNVKWDAGGRWAIIILRWQRACHDIKIYHNLMCIGRSAICHFQQDHSWLREITVIESLEWFGCFWFQFKRFQRIIYEQPPTPTPKSCLHRSAENFQFETQIISARLTIPSPSRFHIFTLIPQNFFTHNSTLLLAHFFPEQRNSHCGGKLRNNYSCEMAAAVKIAKYQPGSLWA